MSSSRQVLNGAPSSNTFPRLHWQLLAGSSSVILFRVAQFITLPIIHPSMELAALLHYQATSIEIKPASPQFTTTLIKHKFLETLRSQYFLLLLNFVLNYHKWVSILYYFTLNGAYFVKYLQFNATDQKNRFYTGYISDPLTCHNINDQYLAINHKRRHNIVSNVSQSQGFSLFIVFIDSTFNKTPGYKICVYKDPCYCYISFIMFNSKFSRHYLMCPMFQLSVKSLLIQSSSLYASVFETRYSLYNSIDVLHASLMQIRITRLDNKTKESLFEQIIFHEFFRGLVLPKEPLLSSPFQFLNAFGSRRIDNYETDGGVWLRIHFQISPHVF